MSDIEFEMRRRFAELRAQDEANAPAFASVRDRRAPETGAVRIVRAPRRWMIPALGATAAAVLAALWVVTRGPSNRERAQRAARLDSSITAIRWTMPTDGLLTSARRTLQTPALSASVLDAASVPIPGTPFKGD